MKVSRAVRNKVINLIASGQTQRAAAKEAGVTETAVSRWLADDAYRAQLDAAIEQNSAKLRDQIRASMQVAFEVLMSIAANGHNENARIRAAIALLTAGGHLHEQPEEKPGDVVVKLGTGDPTKAALPPAAPLVPIQPGKPMPMADPDAKAPDSNRPARPPDGGR
jgi:predicted transcriptional regulator